MLTPADEVVALAGFNRVACVLVNLRIKRLGDLTITSFLAGGVGME